MIWNPFGKPKRLSDQEKLEFAEIIAKALAAQLDLAKRMGASGGPNPRAIGYVYGWTDAFLRVRGWDMADTSIGVPVLYHAFRHLWLGEEDRLMSYTIAHLSDGAIAAGMMQGGQQYLDWKERKIAGPTGLVRCMIEASEESEP